MFDLPVMDGRELAEQVILPMQEVIEIMQRQAAALGVFPVDQRQTRQRAA